jgi:hypothetical protein
LEGLSCAVSIRCARFHKSIRLHTPAVCRSAGDLKLLRANNLFENGHRVELAIPGGVEEGHGLLGRAAAE